MTPQSARRNGPALPQRAEMLGAFWRTTGYLVGGSTETSDRDKLVEDLAARIDTLLRDQPPERRIVTLRIDKQICFSDAQYALAAVAASSATDVKLAVLKEEPLRTNSHRELK